MGLSRPSSTMREKRLKSRGRASADMPSPWSLTRIAVGASADRRTDTVLLAAPYLMALVSRLMTARRSGEVAPHDGFFLGLGVAGIDVDADAPAWAWGHTSSAPNPPDRRDQLDEVLRIGTSARTRRNGVAVGQIKRRAGVAAIRGI